LVVYRSGFGLAIKSLSPCRRITVRIVPSADPLHTRVEFSGISSLTKHQHTHSIGSNWICSTPNKTTCAPTQLMVLPPTTSEHKTILLPFDVAAKSRAANKGLKSGSRAISGSAASKTLSTVPKRSSNRLIRIGPTPSTDASASQHSLPDI
jgi:hypothetical protein